MPGDSPSSKWRMVAVLFSIAGLNYADRTAISSVFPLIRQDLGMSDVALAATGSLFLWSYAIGSPFAGHLADRLSRSRLIVGSLLGWSLITLLTGLVSSVTQLFLLRVLLGLAECAYLPAAIALIADHHGSGTRATAMGLHTAGLNVGLVAGGTLAGYVGEHYGWRLAFFLLGGSGLALALLAHLFLRDAASSAAQPARSPAWESIASLARVPTYLILLIEAMLISVGVWMFLNWLPLYFRETFQMSLAGAGFSGTLLQVAATLGITVGGYLSDRVARQYLPRRMLLQCLCYFAATPFLLAFLGRPGFAFLAASILLFSFLRSVGQANEQPILCDLLSTRLRSTAVGLMNMGNTFAGGVGILMAGYLKQDWGLAGVFAGVSAIVLISGCVVLAGYAFFFRKDLLRVSEQRAQAAYAGLAESA